MTHSTVNQATLSNISAKNDGSSQATSGLHNNDISAKQSKKTLVRVAEYRQAYDYLFRLVNTDFHACVNRTEILKFGEILNSAIKNLIRIECKRKTIYDKEQYLAALKAAKACQLKINLIEVI